MMQSAPLDRRQTSHRLEQSLQEAHEIYRATFETAPIGIAHTDRSGRFITVNARFCEMLGRTPEELLGQRPEAFTHPGNPPVSNDLLFDVIEGRKNSVRYQRSYARPDGTSVHANVTLSAMLDAKGSVDCVIGLIEDVTAETAARDVDTENELRRRTVQQAIVASLGQVALSGASVEFLLHQASSSVCTVVGADRGEITQWKEGRELVVASYGAEGADVDNVTVPIHCSDGTSWGNVIVRSLAPRTFSSSDADFLRSVATVLGQAIDRARADAEINARVRQQSAIAQLGGVLLNSVAADVYDRVCSLLIFSLAADHASFSELTQNNTLRVVAGQPSPVMPAEIAVMPRSPAGAAILSGAPVVVDDYRNEEQFDAPTHEILSELTVPVKSGTRTVGVLSVQSPEAFHFGQSDVDFVQALANMLAEAIERERSRRAAMLATEERERVTRSLQLVMDSTVEGIYTVDMNGRCTMVNRAAAAFLHRTAEELIGQSMHELLHVPRDGATPDECALQRVLETGEACTIASDVWFEDLSPMPVAYSAAPIVDDGVQVGVVVTFRDLTERRKLEAKLEQAQRLSSLGRLAATVAHEFNNVLMGIAPFVDVARRSRKPETVEAALGHITTAVRRGRRITEDILRFTQPAEPVRVEVDVSECVHSVVTETRPLLPPRIAIEVDCDPLFIDADPVQIHQILMNLILNARDAMPGRGLIAISATRETADARFAFGVVDDASRYVHLVVRDTGAGMTEETLRHAFEPLFTTKRNGTGLGLAVTHQVVQRHDGEIFIESAVGEGTAFHLFLPLRDRTEVSIAEGGGERDVDLSSLRVLLVEDDAGVAMGLMSLLEYEGFDVTLAQTGQEALSIIGVAPPDVVLLDVGLPDMDGRRVYAGIAGMYPDLPVIFSTGHGDRAQLEDVLARPNVRYLLKPYQSRDLFDALTAALSR